jgi:phage antirepressor YoqD-like protein
MAHRKELAHEMFEHISRQRKSGMSIANYAKQIGITTTRLQYWSRKFKTQEETGKDANLKFIDLTSFDTGKNHSKNKRDPEPQT